MAGPVAGSLEAQMQLQMAALQQMLTGQNGGSGEQVNEVPMPYFDPMSMFQ